MFICIVGVCIEGVNKGNNELSVGGNIWSWAPFSTIRLIQIYSIILIKQELIYIFINIDLTNSQESKIKFLLEEKDLINSVNNLYLWF